jgi:murein DD-endopeptidase MepM/ murein hydrolase activator NlpD
LAAQIGSSVGAADDGRVVKVGFDSVSGNYVILGHANGEGKIVSWTAYMHLSGYAPGLHKGESVSAGQLLGYSGATGNAKGEPPHLHFEIRLSRYGGQINPMDQLPKN